MCLSTATSPSAPSEIRAAARATRVLVLEDDPDQLASISAALAEPNWQIVEAGNGRLGLERMREAGLDVESMAKTSTRQCALFTPHSVLMIQTTKQSSTAARDDR